MKIGKIVSLIKKQWPVLVIALVVINVLLSASWLLMGEIHYDIDISRDFLVLSEAIRDRQPFLIGPHSGVIAGVFHGPLWYYLNLPTFIISHGNPVFMGWFWWGLSIGTIALIGRVSKKLFGVKTALLAMLLYSANSIINPMDNLKQFFNPYGAVALSPLFYYFFVTYLKNKRAIYLTLALFTIGLIIQFQMAFGGPVLFVSTVFLLFFFYKNKLFKHLLSFLILLIPLSTFIAFDLRHDFLQTQSMLKYFLADHPASVFTTTFILGRVKSIFTDVYLMLTPGSILFALISSFAFLVIITKYKLYRDVKYSFFLVLYFGYWIFLFSFKGWTGNYYWPFLPLVIILISSLINHLPKKVFLPAFTLLVVWNVYGGISAIRVFPKEVTRRGINSWAYNKLLAEYIYRDAGEDFGYYIFTPDRWIYNQEYALEYFQQKYPQKKSYASSKKRLTYLIVVDPPRDRPDIDPVGWRITDIGIKRESENVKRIDVTTIYKYYLTDEEIAIPHNPYLMDSTFFR
jgi:hypothetical protein